MKTNSTYPPCQIPNLNELYSRYLPEKGSLVEVGGYDGLSYSNTLQLLKQGWHGLYIEPVTEYAEECARNLANYTATVVNIACGNTIGRTTILVREEYSTVLPEVDAFSETLHWTPGSSGGASVDLTTLDRLLPVVFPGTFDLLVIDVEGYEKEVLEGFSSLEVLLPKMIIIELHEKSPLWQSLPGHRETREYVYDRLSMYTSVYADDINTVFVRK